MKKLVAVLALVVACKGASSPTPDPGVIEAGVGTVQSGCAFLEGIDDDGTIRTICATIEEVISLVVPFIGLLREADAGARNVHAACEPLPGTTFCATSAERAKAIAYLVRVRLARLSLDAGAP